MVVEVDLSRFRLVLGLNFPDPVAHPCGVAIQFLGELDLPSAALHLVFCVGRQAGADDPVGFSLHRCSESGLPLRCLFLFGLSYDGNFVGFNGSGFCDDIGEHQPGFAKAANTEHHFDLSIRAVDLSDGWL